MIEAHTDVNSVRDILSTDLENEQIEAFIQDAAVWVTEELGPAGLSTDRLELIERYLAAALVRLRDLGLKSTTLQDVTEHYQVDPNVTDYLLRAAAFDPTGKLRITFLLKKTDTEVVPPRRPLAYVGKGYYKSGDGGQRRAWPDHASGFNYDE